MASRTGLEKSLSRETPRPRASSGRSLHNPRYTKVRLAIALLLREPNLHQLALPIEELRALSAQSGISLLIEMLQILDQEPHLTTPSLLQRFDGTESFIHLQKLLTWDNPDMANREVSFKDTMQAFSKEIAQMSWDDFINNGNQVPLEDSNKDY